MLFSLWACYIKPKTIWVLLRLISSSSSFDTREYILFWEDVLLSEILSNMVTSENLLLTICYQILIIRPPVELWDRRDAIIFFVGFGFVEWNHV